MSDRLALRTLTPRTRSTPVDKPRENLVERVSEELAGGERVLACLPFAAVPKLPGNPEGAPKGRKGRVRLGIRQSWRRYRPLAFTNRRMFVFDSGRTPHPRELLATFPLAGVTVVDVRPGSFGGRELVLRLPGEGDVPFEVTKKDLAALPEVMALLGVPADPD
jgi:hypothetical protein